MIGLKPIVRCSSVFVPFLFVFPVFCFSNTISFTRDDLLNIRQNTPQNLLPGFDFSDVLLDIVVGGAVALVKRYRKHRRRGKWAGALVKLRQRRLRTALPTIHLANLRSLPNKTDELLLLSRTNKDFSNSAALCFTETWLNGDIPACYICLIISWSEQIGTQNQWGNCAAAGRAFTSTRGGVQM